jgi:cyclohexanecarboxyl-CoA dehydrogenase
MNYGLSEELAAIRQTARQFARERLLPAYQETERQGRLDRAVVREMGALGFIGTNQAERHGGAGLDYLTQGLICEEVGAGDFNYAYVPLAGTLVADMLVQGGRPAVIDTWVPRICSGEALPALGLTEPEVGSDAGHLRTRAERDGHDFIINGEKASISLSDQADVVALFARTNGDDPGPRGVSAFLMPLDVPGVSRTRVRDLGSHAVGRGSLFFEDARVPAEHMIGDENKGFSQVMVGFDFSRALIGLMCIGAAQASVDETWSYVSERKAFGSPIVRFEGVSFPLAEAETMLEAARQLCYKTLWLRDAGQKHTSEAAMCKWWPPKLAFEIIKECILLHGHGGYSHDYPHQQRLRDVLGLQIGDGTAQIMKLIIAREKAGRAAVPY